MVLMFMHVLQAMEVARNDNDDIFLICFASA